MNKTELIDHIAQQADLSKAAAGRALDAVIGGVKGALKKGGTVTLVGFGTFAVGKRTARTGRNPRTGAAIKIKAAKVPKFKPGKALKDALNERARWLVNVECPDVREKRRVQLAAITSKASRTGA